MLAIILIFSPQQRGNTHLALRPQPQEGGENSTPSTAGNGKKQRFAFCTFITDQSLISPAIVLAQSLRATGTLHDIILMVETNNSTLRSDHPLLRRFFDAIIETTHIPNPYKVVRFNKFTAWLLTQYDKVVYMDVDTLVLHNVDDLFDRPELSAAPDIYYAEKFNSGVMVLKPSQEKFKMLKARVHEVKSYNKGDQGFLNAFFSDWYSSTEKRLPMAYNAMVFFPETYNAPSWFDRENLPELLGHPIKIVHFANPWFKPWNMGSNSSYSRWTELWWKFNRVILANGNNTMSVSQIRTLRESDPLLSPLQKPSPWPGLYESNFGSKDKTSSSSSSRRKNPKHQTSKPDVALATVLADETHATAAAVWALTYLKIKPVPCEELLLIVPDTVDPRNVLFENFTRVITVKAFEQNKQMDKSFLLLHLWNQTQYEKIVFVDVLSMFVDNITGLFRDYLPFAAPYHAYPPDKFTVNVMLLEPSKEVLQGTFSELIEHPLATTSDSPYPLRYAFQGGQDTWDMGPFLWGFSQCILLFVVPGGAPFLKQRLA